MLIRVGMVALPGIIFVKGLASVNDVALYNRNSIEKLYVRELEALRSTENINRNKKKRQTPPFFVSMRCVEPIHNLFTRCIE